MTDTMKPKPLISVRVDKDVADRAQKVADALYDGSLSMLTRIAVKRFVAEKEDAIRIEREELATAS